MRIAMWSGPRNLSTAMMYAFAARDDFAVWDEPFYGAYLNATGLDHPMREAIISAGEPDPKAVAARCFGVIPETKKHFYMKHMPHHMLPDFPIKWTEECVNIHLIRHPARVVASYAAKRESPTLEDIGFRQQVEVFERVGGVVLDSAAVRDDPEGSLMKLCETIGLQFDPAMLSWPKGGHRSDGAWAPHWYPAVHQSTGFAGPEKALPILAGKDAKLVDLAMPYYEKMRANL
ncbi:MAG: HAD family hydrolase [Paracoccaceae bacterium]